ncbi:hypothetical protein TeGR_g7120, partial [Tetraparma gracilis]
MQLLSDLLRERDPRTRVHLCECNEGRTLDGVAAGGGRVAKEIRAVLGAQVPVTVPGGRAGDPNPNAPARVSLLGNSLGGLYMRHAAAELFGAPLRVNGRLVEPHKFVTTASPSLGVADHTYLPLPQKLLPALLRRLPLPLTYKDLFLATPLVHAMCTEPSFLGPLSLFSERVALASGFAADFLVPASTGLFLAGGDARHSLRPAPNAPPLVPAVYE